MALAVQELSDALRKSIDQPHGTRHVCAHPIFKLWAHKMYTLAGYTPTAHDLLGAALALEECEKLRG